jgi:hypothetical protein
MSGGSGDRNRNLYEDGQKVYRICKICTIFDLYLRTRIAYSIEIYAIKYTTS